MVGKLFHSSNSELKDNSKIHFSKPKIDKNRVLKSDVFYMEEGKPKIEYQTDFFELVNGIQTSVSGLKYIDIPSNQVTGPFFDFVSEMDELVIGRVFQNRKKWFSEDMNLDQDTIDKYYKNLLRNGKINGNSTTFIRLRINPDVILKNHYGHKIDFDKIGADSKVQLKLLFDGLLFYHQLITPEYFIQEIKCYDGKLDIKSFHNDLPTITSEKINSAYETDIEYGNTNGKEETDAEDLMQYEIKNEEVIRNERNKRRICREETDAEDLSNFEEKNEAFVRETLGDIREDTREDTLGYNNGLNQVQNYTEIDEMLAKTLSKANALENTENGELDDIENQVVFLLEKIKRMKESSKISQTSQHRSNQSESELLSI
jgi:hypothetical protein